MKLRQKKGFTLIEILIGIVLFVVFLGVVTSSYIDIVRGQQQANEVRKMYSQVRDFVDLFSQEVRLSSIDYGCYTGAFAAKCGNLADSSAGSGAYSGAGGLFAGVCRDTFDMQNGRSRDLSLIRKDGLTKTVFHYDPDTKKIQMVQYDANPNGGGWQDSPRYPGGEFRDVFDERVAVENLQFAINPDVDPYSGDYYCRNQKQFQPKVTLFMQVKNSANERALFSLDYQTTVSSRVYSRL